MDEALPFLERAHLLLLDALAEAEASEHVRARIHFALGRLYFSLDGRYDPLVCTRDARAALAELPVAPSVVAIDENLAEAERLLVFVAFRPLGRPRRLIVSQRLPQLFHIDRPVIAPGGAAPLPDEPPAAPSVLPAGFVADPLPALSRSAWSRIRQEELFSEICALMAHRIPQLGESWRGAAFLEERLLKDVDALVAVGPSSLGDLEKLVAGSAAPDPSELLGLTFIGACLAGRDGLGMADRLRRRFEQEPEFVQAWQDGLALAPHPGIKEVLRAYGKDPLPERRSSAIATLARREEANVAELHAACFDDEIVSKAALVPFVLTADPRARYVVDELRYRAEQSANPGFKEAFTVAAVLVGAPFAQGLAEQALRSGQHWAARIFGICSERRDAELLLEWTATEPTAPLVEALGWAGDPECLPLLIGLLNVDDEATVVSAAAALERITGAGLKQMFAISAEGVITAEPATKTPELQTPQNARDPFPEPTADRIELPSRDAEAWRAHYLAHQSSLVPHVRTRRGVPYSPHVGLYELDQLPCSPIERKTLHHELIIRSGLAFFFDTEAFVPIQERRIVALQHEMRQRSASPGTWERPLERSASSSSSLPWAPSSR